MKNGTNEQLLQILKAEMKPALGVTEPLVVALASARAYQAVGGELQRIRITTDPALFKTGLCCIIPGTNQTGFAIAAVLGVLVGNPDMELEVLRDIDEQTLMKANSLLDKGIVDVIVKEDQATIYVEAVVATSKGVGTAIIEGTHTGVVVVKANEKVIYNKQKIKHAPKGSNIIDYSVDVLIQFAKNVSFDDIEFVLDAVEMNKRLAQEGLSGQFGMRAGVMMYQDVNDKTIQEDPIAWAEALVAAACDARLGGAQQPAMSIAGSGCHGVTATLPIAVVAESRGIANERLARAVALSLLLTIYIKAYSGILSAFCGCAVTAAVGASAGMVFLLGGNDEQIGYAIANMAADITGVICDGANFGCALKTSTGAGSAMRAAFLALRGAVVPAGSGIVGKGVEETIKNIAMISSPGMLETDRVILDIIRART